MNKAMKVINIDKLWNRPNQIKNGDIVEVEWCNSGSKYMVVDSEGNPIRDILDTAIWFDKSDENSGYVQEFLAPWTKSSENILVRHFNESKNIKTLVYWKKEEVLVVTFVFGGIYSYEKIDNSLFDSLSNSDSVGSFFAKNIKPHFTAIKVKS